jgi:dihydrofolate reductase
MPAHTDRQEHTMRSVAASITVSLDGYVAGPDDGPGCGLGVGGERLHYWVFGGPWTYDTPGRGDPLAADKAWLDETIAANGAVICGRSTYEAAGHWGDTNPWGMPVFVVTHRLEEQPPGDAFTFVGSVDEAVRRADVAAGDRRVYVMGGADVMRQALADYVDALTIILAPVVLGAGTRLFEGFTAPLELEQRGVRQSALATFIEYQVVR